MIHNLCCKVLSNKNIKNSPYYLISISSQEISKEAKPGQFIMLGLQDRLGGFLRRPYSVCGANGTFIEGTEDSFQLLYKIVGKGTRALSKVKKGEEILILGPLGNAFEPNDISTKNDTEHLIIAGGVGSAPFPLLIHFLNKSGIKPTMLYGAKNRNDLPLRQWFKKYCGDLQISTEDGSQGRKGVVSTLFKEYKPQNRKVIVYACGPQGMLKIISAISKERRYQALGSFEERMACGFGVCLGCALPVKGTSNEERFKHICSDGPIFNMEEVIFT